MVMIGPVELGMRVVRVGSEIITRRHWIIVPRVFEFVRSAADLFATQTARALAVACSRQEVDFHAIEEDGVVTPLAEILNRSNVRSAQIPGKSQGPT